LRADFLADHGQTIAVGAAPRAALSVVGKTSRLHAPRSNATKANVRVLGRRATLCTFIVLVEARTIWV
jgi:hypothetical protein